ncbi:MAG: GTP-binding protein [Lautropia sp.]
MTDTARIACDLLTGYLGSGKTTLLNAFLRSPASRGTAVVVNEIGSIGLDQIVLGEVSDNVFLLESGCLCCSMSGTLRDTLLDLQQRAPALGAPLARIVVETTGLADPRPILHQFLGDRLMAERFVLDQIVATVDAVDGSAQLDRRRESVVQAALAECVVLTKTDVADDAAQAALLQRLHALNPFARVVRSEAGSGAAAVFTQRGDAAGGERELRMVRSLFGGGPAARGAGGATAASRPAGVPMRPVAPIHDDEVRAVSLSFDGPTTWAGIAAWWRLVSHRYGDRLLRCKALLRLDERVPQVLLQTVGKHFHPPQHLSRWPDDDPRSRLVCIGEGLAEDWLRESLLALRIREASISPLDLAQVRTVLGLAPT